MSNKLKKRSEGFENVRKDLEDEIKKEGGINLTPDLMKKYTENEDEKLKVTEDEFYDIITEMSEGDYVIYKVSQVNKGQEKRGMMVCHIGTVLAFAKATEEEKKEETDEKDEKSVDE